MLSEITTTLDEKYDFILVGGGSASCLIASRLSQQLPHHHILVLEAGQHLPNDLKILTPGLSPSLQSDPKYDWQYISAPEPDLNNRRVKHPRGKVVGGTSAINSHSVVFPNHEWQDRIAKELLPDASRDEWKVAGMRECYGRWQNESLGGKKNSDETAEDRVQTSFPRHLDTLQSNWIKAFEELGHATCSTGFTRSSSGAVTITNAVDTAKAERSHAGIALLDPALERGNVTLKTEVKVSKIDFDQQMPAGEKLHARGVYYSHQGTEYFIGGQQIIVCAGVFESPALLERSGIGSKKVLEAAYVPVRYELMGVGENLQDHLNCSLSAEVQAHIPTYDDAVRDPDQRKAALSDYEENRKGRLAEGPAYSFAFTPLQMLETPSETQELTAMVEDAVGQETNPNLRAQYSFIQKVVQSPEEATATSFLLRSQRNRDSETFPNEPSMVDGNFVTVVAMLAHPFSRGSCHINPDLSRHPDIQFNYLSHPLDKEIFARHLRFIERLFQNPTFTAMRKPDGKRLPRSHQLPITSIDQAKGILPINAATNYHPCGTCSMMKEELGGVVDGYLRVYGTVNVRVCDASVLPIIPRGNILAAVYAWAEKAAEMIVREAKAT